MKLLILLSFLSISNYSIAQSWGTGFRQWLDDEHYVEIRTDKDNKETLKVNAKTGKTASHELKRPYRTLDRAMPKDIVRNWYDPVSKDYTQAIITKDNDLYHFDQTTGKLRQLTANPAVEQNPTFSPDEQKIAFTRAGNLYTLDLKSGLETQLTNDGSDVVYNGWASWVYYEEILGRGSRYRAFWWSPDSKKIAFLRFDDTPVPVFPIYRSTGVHGELEEMHYPKVGDPNPLVSLAIVNLDINQTVWVKTDKNTDQYIAWPFWTKDSKQLLFQQMPRDQNKIELLLANPNNGRTKKIYEESRATWVEFFEDIYMFDDNSGFLLRSYKNDWRNLYYYDFDGKLKATVTNVPWRVTNISMVLEDQKKVFFEGTGKTSTDIHLFSANLDGSDFQQLTQGAGYHYTTISPNGSYFIDRHNSITQASISFLYDNKGKKIRGAGASETPKFDPKKDVKTELFTVKSTDGKFDLPVLWSLPANFDKNKQYPVIFSIYGGPNAGGLSNRSSRRYSNDLTDMGIIVVRVAHRGSGKFGKAGLDYMHRSLGQWEIEDYTAVVKWLHQQPFIDKKRIGITGSSYGGYLSAMALTKGADYFTHGIASLSVIDWRLYDNVYTERYMDTYDQNIDGYTKGSVLTHVPQYKGKLLVIHGLMDDNVHVQNSIQLIDKLQDEKKDFEMMFYPNERHGWGGPKGSHLDRLEKQFWKKHFFGE